MIKHNKKFTDSFVDLKVVGWKTYSKALNDYTFGFYKEQLEQANKAVSDFGTQLKK